MSYTPFNTDFVEIGGVRLTQLNKLIVLAGVQEALANCKSSLRLQNTSAAYQVPVGKKLVAKAIQYACPNGGNATIELGYGDNDVGFGVSTTPTNLVTMYRGASGGGTGLGSGTLVAIQSHALPAFEIPAGKYPSGWVVVWTGTPTNTSYQVFYYLENA